MFTGTGLNIIDKMRSYYSFHRNFNQKVTYRFLFMFGDEHFKPILPDNLLAHPTREPQQVVVAERNAAFIIGHHGNHLKICEHIAEPSLAFAQGFFGPFAFANINSHADQARLLVDFYESPGKEIWRAT